MKLSEIIPDKPSRNVPEGKKKVVYGPCELCEITIRYDPDYSGGRLCLKCWGERHGIGKYDD